MPCEFISPTEAISSCVVLSYSPLYLVVVFFVLVFIISPFSATTETSPVPLIFPPKFSMLPSVALTYVLSPDISDNWFVVVWFFMLFAST